MLQRSLRTEESIMYVNKKLDSKTNRFGLLILLAILLFSVTIFVLYGNENTDVSTETMMGGTNKSTATTDESALSLDPGMNTLAGNVVEIREIPGAEGRGIKIAVSTPQYEGGKVPDANQKEGTILPSKTTEYAFFISDKETEGGKDIKGGEFVTVTFQGEASEKDDVIAKKVEVGE